MQGVAVSGLLALWRTFPMLCRHIVAPGAAFTCKADCFVRTSEIFNKENIISYGNKKPFCAKFKVPMKGVRRNAIIIRHICITRCVTF